MNHSGAAAVYRFVAFVSQEFWPHFDFATNRQNGCEWAGACFADADPSWNDRKVRGGNTPVGSRWDGVTLFVNRQGATSGGNPPSDGHEGMTLAIWGPWKEGAL
jgi:hypothetical protein